MTYEDAVDYLHGLGVLGWQPGLERFSELCRRLGDPQGKFRSVHVGGTNGKGSTVAMIASILRCADFHVGSYYSPYVYDIRERVQIDGEMIDKPSFIRHIDAIRPISAEIGETELGHPTEFEVKTALGFLHFAEQEVDFAVLEVGLGGRLDATNVVNPLVSVITNVGMDHMDRLGDTIAEIASEKAGIIKPEGLLVTAADHPDALEVIRRTCEERNSALWHVRGSGDHYEIGEFSKISAVSTPSASESLTIRGMNAVYEGIRLCMRGDFQGINAATAVGAVEALGLKGIEIPQSAVREGLETAYVPGRLEILRTDPTLLIDAAHNLDGAQMLAQALRKIPHKNLILVLGMASGHSIDDVAGVLAPLASRVYATAADNPRAASAASIAEAARKHCSEVEEITPIAQAVDLALQSAEEDDLVCVAGSFYTICEVPRG